MHNEIQKLLLKAKEICPEASNDVIKKAVLGYLMKNVDWKKRDKPSIDKLKSKHAENLKEIENNRGTGNLPVNALLSAGATLKQAKNHYGSSHPVVKEMISAHGKLF